MEIGLLIESAMALLTPFLMKSGEKVAEGIGCSLWSWIKSKISKKAVVPDTPGPDDASDIQSVLETVIAANGSFAKELEEKIAELQQSTSIQGQITVQNTGTIDKMVNVTSNSGTINL